MKGNTPMARRTIPLSDTQIKKAKPKEKGYKLFDGEGLFLWISTTGGKLWRLKYISPVSAKEKTFSFGKYPTISLAEARIERTRLKQLIKNGIDPSDEKQQTKKEQEAEEIKIMDTFSKVAEEYLLHKTDISDSHRETQRSRLKNHIYPTLEHTPISEISRSDIIDLIKVIESNGTLEISDRVFSLCNAVFKYAAANEKIPYNLLQDIDKKSVFKQREVKHFPVILNEEEIKKLLEKMDNYGGEISTAYALKLLPHFATRPGNLRWAEWKEIDFKKAQWVIPGEKMKIEVKYKGTDELQPHIVPLSTQAIKILKELKRFTGTTPYLFPSTLSTVKVISENTLAHALNRLGYKDRMKPHSFRAMFSTILHNKIGEHDFHSEIIERQLAHQESNKVKAAYNHAEYLPQRKEMMQWWSNYLDKIKYEIS
jgi:integrase